VPSAGNSTPAKKKIDASSHQTYSAATDDAASMGSQNTSDYSSGHPVDTAPSHVDVSAKVGERLYRRGEVLRRHQEQRAEMLRAVSEAYDENGQPLFKVSVATFDRFPMIRSCLLFYRHSVALSNSP
jgi:hypothetical protein